MVSNGKGRTGQRWRDLRSTVYSTEENCWLCGQWVDQTLPALDSRARTADHLVSLQHGGSELDRDNLRLAHRGCNSARSNRIRWVDVLACLCTQGQPCGALGPTMGTPRIVTSVDINTI